MNDKYNQNLRRVGIYLLGPIVILGIVALMALFQNAAYPFRHPQALITLAVVVISFMGGYGPGFVTSVIALLYMALNYFPEQKGTFHYNEENYLRLLSWVLVLPAISLAVGVLRKRSEKALRGEIQASKKRQEDLQLSEERVHSLIRFSNDPFVAIDSHSTIIEWNPQAEKVFGWTAEEAIGNKISHMIIPEEYRTAHHHGLEKYLHTGQGKILNKSIEMPALTKEGARIPIELTVYPVQQKDTVIFGAFLRDISERKQNELLAQVQFNATRIMTEAQSLEEGVPQLLKIFGDSLNWPIVEIWLTDENKKFYSMLGVWAANKQHEETLKKASLGMQIPKSEGLLGKVATDTHPLWITSLHEKEFPRDAVVKDLGIETILYCPINADNDLIGALCLHNTKLLKADVKVMDIMFDLSKRMGLFILRKWAKADLKNLSRNLELKVKERTAELNELNKRLQEEVTERQILYEQAQTANRLKDEFLATISHELRTPMNVILGHSELLTGEELNEDEKKKSIEAIHRNSKAQAHIVNDILDVSKFITGKVHLNMEIVNIADIVINSIDSIMPTASAKSIEVEEKIVEDVGLVSGDATRLQQVMWNLLSNAIKFTPRRGKITVSVTRAESNVVISVRDTGKGIDATFLPYVFERFRQEDATTTRKFGGLGLGLAITRSIVEAHGGNIQATSEGKGHGATFSVILPITNLRTRPGAPAEKSETKKVAENAAPKAPAENLGIKITRPLTGLSILIVDDQVDALMILETILKRAGAEVTTASSAADAFKILVKIKPDLIISDIGMPEQDGYELIRMIRRLPEEMGGTITAIALTAYALDEEQQRALDMGYNAHLSKPTDSKFLIHTIAELFGRQEYEKEPPSH
ncbi:hybrid sensor histidine kinase/response regulator [Bdellovibrio reynosensis]|uniref:histidine kinase n=1 Tax=Bdellovibrio reynosensis TaxID=2835041 RepID=A0ABY4C9Y7_9BACT|nr:ATP-binding protein [Bdellovibrio reynosensis]UOF01554.1 ATP-binding protein [Bdellovibrio reynosensis]